MFKRSVVLFFVYQIIVLHLFSQNTDWKVDYNYFFDNIEFAGSSYALPQTMSGMHVIPSLDIQLNNTQSIVTGVDVLMLSGSQKAIQSFIPVAFYQLKTDQQKLMIGSFPRSASISNYNDFMFRDSINYFRPNLQGIYWNLGNTDKFFNVWLDWTGSQSATQRETFFIGASGRADFLTNFFIDFQSYLFHFAKTRPSLPDQYLCDNAQAIFNAGYSSNKFIGNNKLLLSVGFFSGFERERNIPDQTYIPIGFVAHLNLESNFFGIDSKYFAGRNKLKLYERYGSQLYWSNPLLQSNSYLENKLYIRFLNNKYVQGKFEYRLHFCEGTMYHEQVLTLNASVDKLLFKK